MNYEQDSDDLLNVKVKTVLFGRDWVNEPALRKWHFNNPADAWPVIVDNRINLNAYDDEIQGWFATTDTSFFIDDKNPLRAAMIVFLMMNEDK